MKDSLVSSAKKGISVVIPNFNGRNLLEQNLPPLFAALKNSGLPYEIIISDDHSSDDSVVFLKTVYPQVIVLAHSINSGFSRNINFGLRQAQYDLVLALNNDVSLAPDYFDSLLAFFQDPETFGVMGAIWDPATSQLADAAKVCEQSLFGTLRSTRNTIDDRSVPLFSFFLSGANALVDRSKLEQLGFFDEIYSPFYQEDVDLGLRAWRMGWKSYFSPRAKAFHSASSTIAKHHSISVVRIVSLRNRWILHDIHLDSLQRFLFFFKLGLDVLSRWMLGDISFYRSLGQYFSRRAKVKQSRFEFKRKNPVFSTQEVVHFLQENQKGSHLKLF